MINFIKRHLFIITLSLSIAIGITTAFFPPALLLTALAGAGTIGALITAAIISCVVWTAVAFGVLQGFSMFFEWLSPTMLPSPDINQVNPDHSQTAGISTDGAHSAMTATQQLYIQPPEGAFGLGDMLKELDRGLLDIDARLRELEKHYFPDAPPAPPILQGRQYDPKMFASHSRPFDESVGEFAVDSDNSTSLEY